VTDDRTAHAFAADWIAAWNAHDIERILGHYSGEIVFHSPLAAKRVGTGRIVGLDALRSYWSRGLRAQPDLHFRVAEVLVGHDCVTIRYRNHRGQSVAETCEFDACGKVGRAYACYAEDREKA